MFKTIAQIVLAVAVSAGLAVSVSPDARNSLGHAWGKVEAAVTHVFDWASQTAIELTGNVSSQTNIDVSTEAGASTEAGTEGNLDLSTSLEGRLDGETQAEIAGSADADTQARGSSQSTIESESFLNILFGAGATSK
ncbi:MAG: hypothetical protein AB1345_09390 [Chloroflexota bacterium]